MDEWNAPTDVSIFYHVYCCIRGRFRVRAMLVSAIYCQLYIALTRPLMLVFYRAHNYLFNKFLSPKRATTGLDKFTQRF